MHRRCEIPEAGWLVTRAFCVLLLPAALAGGGCAKSWSNFWELAGSASGTITVSITAVTPAFATEGETVKISYQSTNGSWTPTTLKIGTATVSFATTSANELSFTVPAGLTSGKINISNGEFQANSESDFIIYKYFIYVSNFTTNNISGYSVNILNGFLTPTPNSPYASGISPRGVISDPQGRFLFSPNNGALTVSQFKIIGTTGELTSNGSFSNGVAPSFAMVDPTGKYLYVTSIAASNFRGYEIDQTTGVAATLAGSPYATTSNTLGIAMHPSGKFLYVTENSGTNFVGVVLNTTAGGVVGNVPLSPYTVAGSTTRTHFDSTGQFVYAASLGGSLFAYSVNQTTGQLSPVSGSPYATGLSARGVVVDLSGRYLYAGDDTATTLKAYARDSAGALTPLSPPSYVNGNGSYALVTDPAGKYIYSANNGSNNVTVFSINSANGALTPVPGSPFAAGTAPYSLCFVKVRQ